MNGMKRLGPQDPLSWIKDTRRSIPQKSQYQKRSLSEKKTFRIHTEDENPLEITVEIKGNSENRTVCVKVAEEGKKTAKIEFKSSDKSSESSFQTHHFESSKNSEYPGDDSFS